MNDRNEVANHEKLIKEAASAIRDARTVTIRGEDGSLSVAQADDETLARAALAVFEKAHTPTDHEGEALARAIYLWDVAESVSSTTWEDLLGPNGKHGNRHTPTCGCDFPEPQGEPSDEIICTEPGHAHCDRNYIDAEPQGEPSGAEVFAFIRGYYPLTHAKMQGHWSDNSIERVRDGLRAAGAVR